MNIEAIRENYRPYLFGAIGIAATAVFFAFTYNAQAKAYKRTTAKKAELTRFVELGRTYSAEKDAFKPIEEKLSRPVSNAMPGPIIEGFGAKTGIRKKIISFKPIDEKRERDYVKRGVEVTMNGVTLNELVNLLYRIEGHGNLMAVEGFSMKPVLPSPDAFDVVMEVYLVVKEAKAPSPEPDARRGPLKKTLKPPSAARGI